MIVDSADDSLGGLLRRAKDEISNLVRLEIESARQEVAAWLKRMSLGLAAIVAAIAFALFAVVAVTMTAILVLSLVVAPWLAAAIVTFAYVLIALICALVGRSILLRAVPPLPVSSLRHMKEDVRWISRRASSAKA